MEQTVDAGEKKASTFNRLLQLILIPLQIYFITIPVVKYIWRPILPTWLTGYEPPLPEFGP
jgi:hypothetical protein